MNKIFATKRLIILLLILLNENLFAQELLPIILDRPDQTESPFIVPKGYIQMEHGFTFEKINSDEQVFSHPSTLWKYGLNDKVEFRLITEFVTEKSFSKTVSGLLPVTLGFKANLFPEKGIVPMISFLGHITTSEIGSKQFSTKYLAPSFRFLFQHTVSEKFSIGYNAGAEWDGETPVPVYIYTFTGGYSVNKKIGCFAEVYGFASSGSKADHRFDCGLTYLLNNDFMLDLSGGKGITDNAPEAFVSIGISFRFKVKK